MLMTELHRWTFYKINLVKKYLHVLIAPLETKESRSAIKDPGWFILIILGNRFWSTLFENIYFGNICPNTRDCIGEKTADNTG